MSAHNSGYQTTYNTAQPTLKSDDTSNHTSDLNGLSLNDHLSPLDDMDWINTDSNTNYLDDLDPGSSAIDASNMFEDTGNLDWLSDVIQIESQSAPNSSNNQSLSFSNSSNADPILAPKTHDVLNIFNMDDCDLRGTGHLSPSITGSWDRPLGQPSHHM